MQSTMPAPVSAAYRGYVLVVLLIVYALNLLDRNIMSVLQVPIKAEFGLSDAQLGILTGFAFGLLYALMAIPISLFADRGYRKQVVALAVLVFSLMTAGCGLAGSFLALALFRVGVGIGEAGGVPPSASLISDYFPRDRRAFAMSIYGLGSPVGAALGVMVGGWLADSIGWRSAFLWVGGIGALIAPLVWMTVRELPRGAADSVAVENAGLPETVRTLWSLRAFRHWAAAGAVHAIGTYAVLSWNTPFFHRVHAMALHDVTTRLGPILGVSGAIGVVLGGAVATRMGRRDLRWYAWVPALSCLLLVPSQAAQYLAPSAGIAFIVVAASGLLHAAYTGPFFATAQSLVAANMRSMTQAVILMTFNIVGLGIGPWLTGALSDLLAPRFGELSLRYALVIIVLFEGWAAFHFWRAGRYLRQEMTRPQLSSAGSADVV